MGVGLTAPTHSRVTRPRPDEEIDNRIVLMSGSGNSDSPYGGTARHGLWPTCSHSSEPFSSIQSALIVTFLVKSGLEIDQR